MPGQERRDGFGTEGATISFNFLVAPAPTSLSFGRKWRRFLTLMNVLQIPLSARRFAVSALNAHEREGAFVVTPSMTDDPQAAAVAFVQMGCAVAADGKGGLVVRCPRRHGYSEARRD
ncbi:hypothetical protein EON82_06805 [bacterium]|nr:MAG: hypothetical protein EON82_06805 [bacterium]